MTMLRSLFATLAIGVACATHAQIVVEPAAKTIKCTKAEVTCIAMSPKGDKVLVGLDKGAEIYDLESGKKLFTLAYNEDESTVVYYCAFNDNGEYVVLIGYSGKRQVWDVKTGKQEKVIASFNWIPDPRATKAMGLANTNSKFDRFYQQSEAPHARVTAKAVKNGGVEFVDGTGEVVQSLTYAENKDMHHRAPCLFYDKWFVTGTDDGRVLFYDMR